jgi:hypothetical protein
MDSTEVIAKIQDKEHKGGAEVTVDASLLSPSAVKPLAEVMANPKFSIARQAKNVLWQLVRHAGRPGADDDRKATVTELLSLSRDNQPTPIRREVIWMLSEIAGNEAVDPVAALLVNQELREDARMVLQRLPGEKSLAALQSALASAPDDFKPNIAVSLRQRGVNVPGVPDAKLVPSKATKVTPVGR